MAWRSERKCHSEVRLSCSCQFFLGDPIILIDLRKVGSGWVALGRFLDHALKQRLKYSFFSMINLHRLKVVRCYLIGVLPMSFDSTIKEGRMVPKLTELCRQSVRRMSVVRDHFELNPLSKALQFRKHGELLEACIIIYFVDF